MNEPQIRFKRFHGVWIPYTLGEMVTFSKGSGYSKTDLCKEGNPIILYGRMYTKYESVIDTVDTFVIPKNNSVYSTGGEVIIPGSGESPEDISVASTVKNAGVILGGDLNILKFDTKLYDPTFMAMAITYSPTRMQLSVFAQGKTIVHLRNSDIAKGYVYFPHIEEQKVIARYVSSLDTHISTASSRLASLKQVKEASLQAMFPQKGETVPKIRFKGFEGEWKKVKLSSFAKRIKRKNSCMESTLALTIASALGLVSQNDYFNNSVVGANIRNYYLLKRGEFAYNKSYSNGYPFGSVKRLDRYEQGILSTLYIVFTIDDSISSDYLTHFFDTTLWHKDVAERAAEGARNHGLLNISAEDFLDIAIWKPRSMEEQQQIASYFTSLDRQIALQTQRLEKLKQIKAACLDKMFV
jgi:Restriction endonuclease S subunits